MLKRIAVYLRGTAVQEASAVAFRHLKQPASAIAIRAERLDGIALVARGTGGTREMIYAVHLRKGRNPFRNVTLDEGE
jgi:hypothetical protein